MIYFRNLTKTDRVTFEGREVKQTIYLTDKSTNQVTHYTLVVSDNDGGATSRKFRAEEIPHLIEREILVIDRGYYSIARQTDRDLYGENESRVLSKKQRERADRIVFLARRMEYYYALGMKLTEEGVWEFSSALEAEYRNYQSMVEYGTAKPNSTQSLKPLPSVSTLLEYYRVFRRSGEDPRVFSRKKSEPEEMADQEMIDLRFVLTHLYEYAESAPVSKKEVGENTLKAVKAENERRRAIGYPLISERSADRYSRWIDLYLDPFVVMAQREGLTKARKKFGSVDKLKQTLLPGEQVQFDAWKVHVVTLDTTREKWLRMTEEEQAKVPRVRRWIVVAIDVASRIILGFALCRNPSQAASLEALRMCFMDKTPLFLKVGITYSGWSHRTPIQLVVTDSGSEFGKHPFGGAEFAEAVRRVGASLMSTVAGIPELRGVIERLFLTFDLKWARKHPGWTAANPQKRNDRKAHLEASLTDDELYRQVVRFIAEYNASEHRGIDRYTPDGMWNKLIQDPGHDPTMMPMPKDLREACGFFKDAAISEDGIRFENINYSNGFIRGQRTLPEAERIDRGTGKVEIKVDPMDLGAISVAVDGGFVAVKAVDSAMIGMTLSDWRELCARRRADARADVKSHANAREEARRSWEGEAAAIAKSAGVDIRGKTISELSRAALELHMGKGHHEEPFIGRDEYIDPVTTGFNLSGEEDGPPPPSTPDPGKAGEVDPNRVEPDPPNSLDRFRASIKPRSPSAKSQKDDKK